MDRRLAAYWTLTSFFAAAMLLGGIADLMQIESLKAEVLRLGFPHYLLTILGIAKLLGATTVIVPGLPLLKEWAYVGFAVELVGATSSHAIMADPTADTLRPVAILLLAAGSYLLRPAERRLAGTPGWY